MSNGKGDKRRPKMVSNKIWNKNWQKIFGQKKKISVRSVDKLLEYDRMKESKQENQSCD